MTVTPNFGWPQPAVGASGWGAAMDAMILQQDGLPQFIPKHLVRYVDYLNGNDGAAATRGLGPGYAYKTIQAAYNELKTTAQGFLADAGKGLGVGRIVCLPGRHDVGGGVLFVNNRPVEICGFRQGSTVHFLSDSASIIVSSSSAATEMFKMPGTQLGYGFNIHDLGFMVNSTVNTSLTKVIYANKVGNLVVERCSFDNYDNITNTSICAIYHEDAIDSTGEAGWYRVRDNNCSRLQLYKCQTNTGAAGGNWNYGDISWNTSFYGGSLPSIHLNGNVNHLSCQGNCLEGTATAIQIGPTGVYLQNNFIENSGEDDSAGTPPNPFYDLQASVSQQVILGGICTSPFASGYGTWVKFGANAYRNYVLGVFDLVNTTVGYKRLIQETSHGDKNYLVPISIVTPAYTVTNPTADRALNVTADTLPQVAQVLGTLIADLQARGVLK